MCVHALHCMYAFCNAYIRLSPDIPIWLRLDVCLWFRQGTIPSKSQDFSESWAPCCRCHMTRGSMAIELWIPWMPQLPSDFVGTVQDFYPQRFDASKWDINAYIYICIYIYMYIYIYTCILYMYTLIYVIICDTNVYWRMHKTYIILHPLHLWPQAFPAPSRAEGFKVEMKGGAFCVTSRLRSLSICWLSESDINGPWIHHGAENFWCREVSPNLDVVIVIKNFCGSSPIWEGYHRKPSLWFQLESKRWSIHMDKIGQIS